MKILPIIALAIGAIVVTSRTAVAYPQYQLSRDTTCTGCHLSPDGGSMLNENGITVAESTAWKAGDGNFLNGVETPTWLSLGGDARGAAGFIYPGVPSAGAYPMQIEGGASARASGFTVHALAGFRSPQDGGSPLHVLWSREHYVMWHSNPGGTDGIYLRAGRFAPTFGLRLAEHIVYTQKFGGRPLYSEAYGLGASFVKSTFEVHATGFVHDPLITTAETADGAALYAELRIGPHAAVGVEGKYAKGDEQTHAYGGITGKVYVPSIDLLFQAEAEVIQQKITEGAGDTLKQLAGYLLASKQLDAGLLLDIGVGHFTQDMRVKGLYRDCLDANLHWFVTPHLEGLLTTRVELFDGGGPTGGWVLVQAHYRL